MGKKVKAKVKTERKVLMHKTINVGVAKYIAISRKGDKLVAGANTRQGLAEKLKKKRGSFFIIENPKVREAEVTRVPKKRKGEGWKKYLIY